ncbi:MAG: tRNA adenosine(34) deaminase TadA [Candidatus Atribacteria bacterium]|nr:tRNA adenosine(34) deaminase TadA [Candidatus Atribacteria bacterium]
MEQSESAGMEKALGEALRAREEDEVPVGACIMQGDYVIALGHNRREKKQDVTAHAEMEAIREACRHLGSWRLEGCVLYVTLEPCLMCAGAILQARLKKVCYGAQDPKAGAAGSVIDVFSEKLFNHIVEIEGGICEERCRQILREYFKIKR